MIVIKHIMLENLGKMLVISPIRSFVHSFATRQWEYVEWHFGPIGTQYTVHSALMTARIPNATLISMGYDNTMLSIIGRDSQES